MTLLLALSAACSVTYAQDVTVYAAITSDYVHRGISNSDEHGAIQLGLDVSADNGLFGGIWASTTDITTGNRNRPREVDYYLGYVHFFDDDWSTTVSINRYSYPGADTNIDYDYTEWAVIVGYQDDLWFEIDYTDSLFGHNEPAFNFEALARWPLPAELSLTAGVGYFDVSEIADNGYWYWQIGTSRSFNWLTIDLRYHDTGDVPARISVADLADARAVLTFSAAF